jgi:hypothetical protein
MLVVQCLLFNACCSMLVVQCLLFNACCSMQVVQCKLFNARCSMQVVQCHLLLHHWALSADVWNKYSIHLRLLDISTLWQWLSGFLKDCELPVELAGLAVRFPRCTTSKWRSVPPVSNMFSWSFSLTLQRASGRFFNQRPRCAIVVSRCINVYWVSFSYNDAARCSMLWVSYSCYDSICNVAETMWT